MIALVVSVFLNGTSSVTTVSGFQTYNECYMSGLSIAQRFVAFNTGTSKAKVAFRCVQQRST